MVYAIIFITSFILVIAYYYLFEIRKKKRKKNNILPVEALFLIRTNNLDKDKIGRNKLLWTIALNNAFGISITLLLTNLVSTYILKLIFALAFAIIYSIISNYIIGKMYVKKGYLKKKAKKDK